jgi:FdhD protein
MLRSDVDGEIAQARTPEELIVPFGVVALDRDLAIRTGAEVCIEERVNLLLNGTRVASLAMTPADLEAFACGYLVCEGFARSVLDVDRVDVWWPEVSATMQMHAAGLRTEIRSQGCVGLRSPWSDLTEPIRSDLAVDVPTIFASMSLINDLAALWSRTGGAHCSVICDRFGGLVSYAEDLGRYTAVDKAVGKALLDGRDLTECFLISTGRLPAGMVAKAYRAGIPLIVSNTAPLTSGVELARRLGMTLVCFARQPHMSVYSGPGRIRGLQTGGN